MWRPWKLSQFQRKQTEKRAATANDDDDDHLLTCRSKVDIDAINKTANVTFNGQWSVVLLFLASVFIVVLFLQVGAGAVSWPVRQRWAAVFIDFDSRVSFFFRLFTTPECHRPRCRNGKKNDKKNADKKKTTRQRGGAAPTHRWIGALWRHQISISEILLNDVIGAVDWLLVTSSNPAVPTGTTAADWLPLTSSVPANLNARRCHKHGEEEKRERERERERNVNKSSIFRPSVARFRLPGRVTWAAIGRPLIRFLSLPRNNTPHPQLFNPPPPVVSSRAFNFFFPPPSSSILPLQLFLALLFIFMFFFWGWPEDGGNNSAAAAHSASTVSPSESASTSSDQRWKSSRH